MNTEDIIKTARDTTNQAVEQGNRNLNELKDKTQSALNDVQKVMADNTLEAQRLFLEQQENIKQLNDKLVKNFQQNPAPWYNVGVIWSEFQAAQFSTYLKSMNKQAQEVQNLLTQFNQNYVVDSAKQFKEQAQQAEDRIKKTSKK